MQKKILIHSIVFSPDGVSTAYIYNDIALKFVERGFEVVVLTTTPHYNLVPEEISKQPLKSRWGGIYYESRFKGIRVLHVPQRKYKSTILRLVGFLYWHILSLALGLAQRNVSVILSPSPPLTIGLINLIIGKLKKAKVIYNVQEIYPDFLINQGTLKVPLFVKSLQWLEKFVYNNSDAVTTIDAVFYQTIKERFKDKSKLSIIPNFVDTELFRPNLPMDDMLDNSIFPNDERIFKIMYAGNIGHAQDWDPLINAAVALRDEPIEFWIIGEGVKKCYLEEQVENYGLKNIHLIAYQNRRCMPALISYADLHFIFMTPEMEGQGFPSKVYTIMACAKPLLVSSGIHTPITNFLGPAKCAFLADSNDISEKNQCIVDLIKYARNHPTELQLMGQNGFTVVQQRYTSEAVSEEYVTLINKIVKV